MGVGKQSSNSLSRDENGYSLWEYTGKEWAMKKDCSRQDCMPAKAPLAAGRFRGQLRVLVSVPMS